MNYKVGDTVMVRHQYHDFMDGCDAATSEMFKTYGGKVLTIVAVSHSNNRYRMKEDSQYWSWVDDMLLGIVQVNKKAPKNGQLPEI